ncbi:MAG: hypothetical protein ACT4P6_17985 [Gemmatimonadaceae bacterium]
MLRRDLGVEVDLLQGPYGSLKIFVDDEEVVDAGVLAFMGVMPTLAHIRERVAARLQRTPTPPA